MEQEIDAWKAEVARIIDILNENNQNWSAAVRAIRDVLFAPPLSLGIERNEDLMEVLIRRGTCVPTEAVKAQCFGFEGDLNTAEIMVGSLGTD